MPDDAETYADSGKAASDQADQLAQKGRHSPAADAYSRAGDDYERAAKDEASEADRAGDTRAGCIYRCKSAEYWEQAAQAREKAAAEFKAAGASDTTKADTAEAFAAGDYEEAANAFEKCAACRSARDHHAQAAEAFERASRCWGKVRSIYVAWEKERDNAADHAKTKHDKEDAEDAASSHHKKVKQAESNEKADAKKAAEEKAR